MVLVTQKNLKYVYCHNQCMVLATHKTNMIKVRKIGQYGSSIWQDLCLKTWKRDVCVVAKGGEPEPDHLFRPTWEASWLPYSTDCRYLDLSNKNDKHDKYQWEIWKKATGKSTTWDVSWGGQGHQKNPGKFAKENRKVCRLAIFIVDGQC